MMLASNGINPTSVRIMRDFNGESKGSAFVDFGGEQEAQAACALDGRKHGGGCGDRPLRINPGNRN